MTDFEKVLRETQSEETFKITSSSDEEFRNWLERLEEVAEEYSKLVTGNNVGRSGWIPCSERLPEAEREVLILARKKYIGGRTRYITTTAMYEDGTIRENDSCWNWQDIDGEWDEEEECYIIPEGWWEHRHYNPDEVYNNAIDNEVIAWMPLPEPYRGKE